MKKSIHQRNVLEFIISYVDRENVFGRRITQIFLIFLPICEQVFFNPFNLVVPDFLFYLSRKIFLFFTLPRPSEILLLWPLPKPAQDVSILIIYIH